MKLDLREIVGVPGAAVDFDYGPDLADCSVEGAFEVLPGANARGFVKNSAGALTLQGVLVADLKCCCARCLKEFSKHIELDVDAPLADDLQDEDNPDIFLLEGDSVDLDEVFRTAFTFHMPQRLLCFEDCKGLCDRCGKNLNDGPCSCTAEADPRLAVLRQLLEK